MKQNYDLSLTEVLKSEGGYSNDAGDPGGPTNFGITIADYRRYINRQGTAQDVRRMKLDDAKRIYKSAYWDALNCDELQSGVDYCVFDYGVNSGVGRARRVLDRFRTITDPIKLINAICDERLSFLRQLHTWSLFGRGWTTRVAKVRQLAVKMAHDKAKTSVVAKTAVIAAPTAVVVGAATAHVANNYPHALPYLAVGGVIGSIALIIAGFTHWRRR